MNRNKVYFQLFIILIISVILIIPYRGEISAHSVSSMFTVNSSNCDLPSYFDLRDVNGNSFVTSVKNQGSYETSWCQGAMAAMEGNLLMTKNWDNAGESGEPDLSEAHLDWWNGFNTHNNDDDHEGDGLEPHFGGDYMITSAYLIRGEGTVREEDAPYNEIEYPPDRDHSSYHYYYTNDIEWYIAGSDLEDINKIKNKLMTEGIIGTAICVNPSYLYDYGDYYAHYQPPETSDNPDHAVAICGWDDDKVTSAPNPGAWLCKNSWGEDWGPEAGFFWISYYDKWCCQHPEMGAVSFQDVEYHPYKNIYYHDYHGWRNTMNSIIEAFNAFSAIGDEILNAVSFFTTVDNVNYIVKIYDRFINNELLDELSTTSGTLDNTGFHTIFLDNSVKLNAGDDFYIYLKLSAGGYSIDQKSDIPIPLGTSQKVIVKSSANPKESYHRSIYWLNQDILTASDGKFLDEFGCSVSISGDYAIIGARSDDDSGDFSGSAYIFKRNGTSWTQQGKLLALDEKAGDWFGYSVSIDGDYAIVGSPRDDANGYDSGSAYIFKRNENSWTQEAELLPLDGEANDWFGYSVSINGDYAIMGAIDDDENGFLSGSAYIFKRNGSNWIQEDKLLALDGTVQDKFGFSVSLNGDYALVGSPRDDDSGDMSGSAYIFKRNGKNWIQEDKLLAFDGADEDEFGYSTSIDGDYAIIGARDDDNGENSGSAYIFRRNGANWTQQAKLIASDGHANDCFGNSVSIYGDYAIIGAYRDDDNGYLSGSAYLFKHSGESWIQEKKIIAFDGQEQDGFGSSVSINGDYFIIGASGDDGNVESTGSAYIFKKSIDFNWHDLYEYDFNDPTLNHTANFCIKGLTIFIPKLECNGKLNWENVEPGNTVEGSFTIRNIGEQLSLLDWEITEYPEWGEWTFFPKSGKDLSTKDSPITVEVEIEVPNEPNQEFPGDIKVINTINPNDYCTIPVYIKTSRDKSYINIPFLDFLRNHLKKFPIIQIFLWNLRIF